jgi:hypothetical protein
LKIPIYNLTIDKVDELEKEFKQSEDNLAYYMAMTEKTMWLEDIKNFEKVYQNFLNDYK